MHRRLLVAAAVTALAFPAVAAADTQQASLGAVTATISWVADLPPHDFRVTIARAGQTLVDEPVNLGGPAPWTGGRQAVNVVDLDADGEPEVVVDEYTGGAHCCTVTRIWHFTGAGYAKLEHDWGNQLYELRDLGRGARPEFLTADDRFSYAFGSYAESRWPVLILTYRTGRLRDVTARFPAQVKRDLSGHRRLYRRTKSRPALAAYVADLHRLGRHRAARRVLRHADVGRKFVRTLNRLLREGRYLR